mmetsp:Transcript_88774/g.129799  ORF Transcript_88774/g.129799 Transcript_88774/m.129799 type:complete len:146 (+) Transcript_88774:53-490(+)
MPWNGLHAHAMNGKSNEIKEEILMEGTICRERTQLTGMQPIHKACMYGQKAAVDQLFELGADIKCTTNWGSTCLHWIVKGSSPLSLHPSFFSFLSHKQPHSHTHTLTHTCSQSVSNMQTDTHVFSHRLCIPQGRRNCRPQLLPSS